MAKKEAKKVEFNSCLCGCGGKTKSRFVIGHDMKLKSVLRTAASIDKLSKKQSKLIDELGWAKLVGGPTPSRREAKAKGGRKRGGVRERVIAAPNGEAVSNKETAKV